jgi:hypothetical protein
VNGIFCLSSKQEFAFQNIDNQCLMLFFKKIENRFWNVVFYRIFDHSLKNKHLIIMKQTRTKWAIVVLIFVFTRSLSAQNFWTPIQKEWWTTVVKLLIKAKNMPVQNTFEKGFCAVSNEITITVGRCSDAKKEDIVLNKPVQ